MSEAIRRAMDQMTDPAGPSPLTDVLRGVRLARSFYCESTLRAPWGFENPALPIAQFHFALRGGYSLSVEGGAPVEVREGDMVLMPNGHAHRLSDTPGGLVVDVMSIPRTRLGENASCIALGGDGDETFLICGGMRFEPAWHPMMASLPPMIVARKQSGGSSPWLAPLFELLKGEAGAARPGGEALITRLIEVLVIATLRDWAERAKIPTTGWLVAIQHPQIGRALGALHGDPHRPWTLAELALKAGMSRSVFTERFTTLCGVSPGQYVTHCRINLAGDILRETKTPLAEVAERLGYSSEATFSRAFKRGWGVPPGRFRREPLPAQRFAGSLNSVC